MSAPDQPSEAFQVHLAGDAAAVRRCWPALRQLRPHLQDADDLAARWARQRDEGYRLAYVEQDGAVVAALGYRVLTTLAWGKIVYVDDLVALDSHHGQGHGSRLLAWIKEEARRLDCDAVHLDTGYQRHAAHKAYLRNGFELNCHHMACKIK